MKIAVASGKGGTGKTLVSVNLAATADRPIRLLDCDVEAPNAYRQTPKGVKLVVYCLGGVRGARAVSFLREHGYAKAVSLQGRYTAWQAAK